jgi:hypothetical protein
VSTRLARITLSIPVWMDGALPIAASLALFHLGLLAWFQQDDFSWLHLELHTWRDFWRLLTEPRAQGTIRPLSERFFFITFREVFGFNPVPYRVFVFLTQAANLWLLWTIGRRLLVRRAPALVAPLVWGVNLALVAPLGWTSAYNQVLCAFFYLTSFWLFLRHLETGRRSFYAAQILTFLLGFGALETIVAYPAVLLAYCLLDNPKQARKALPLFLPSAAYAAAHFWLIPRASDGPYALHFDGGMVRSLWDYWTWVLGPVKFAQVAAFKPEWGLACVAALTAGLILAGWLADRRGRRLAVFGLAWFVLTLAPVLPLRDHQLDYYLTIPAIGLGLAVAALVPHAPRPAAAAWLAMHLGCSAGVAAHGMRSTYERSQRARQFVEAVRQVRQIHPEKAILLTGVDEQLFYAVMYDDGFRTFGLREVFLAPTGNRLESRPGYKPLEVYRLPARNALAALRRERAVVYQVAAPRLHNITNRYRYIEALRLQLEPPRRVDVGLPQMAEQLGPGWFEIQQSHRWMGRRAEVRLAGPRSAADRLRIEAIYPEHSNWGAIALTVAVNGTEIATARISDSRSARRIFALPPECAGQEEITVTLETDRTIRLPDDPRHLGLAFGVIELLSAPGTGSDAMIQ